MFPTCLVALASQPRHTRLCSAVGRAPAGPRHAQGSVEPLRHTLANGAPQAAGINDLVSPTAPGQAPGTRWVLVHGTPGSAAARANCLLQAQLELERTC